MTRLTWLVLAAALAACSRPAVRGPLLPETAGDWRRGEVRELPVSAAPEIMPRASVKRILAANYEGPGKAEATVYEMSSSAIGLDMAQRWRSAADSVFFYRDQYFVVVKWEGAGRTSVGALVRALEKNLAPAK
jgi:hypothetical protein